MPKQVEYNGEIWTEQRVRELISTTRKNAIKALLLVYSYQTASEQVNETTIEVNGKGFNHVDGNILSSFAQQWESRKWLSEKQWETVFKCMPKYSGQVYKYIEQQAKKQAA